MTTPNGYVFDLETDDLYPYVSKIWFGCLISLDGQRQMEVRPTIEGVEESLRKIREWHASFGDNPWVVTHNGLGFDHWVLWKLLGIPFHVGKDGSDWLGKSRVQFVDTLLLSQYLEPDRKAPKTEKGEKKIGPHTVASYGKQFGLPKLDSPDFSEYSEEMCIYGVRDTKIQLKIFNYLYEKYKQYYPQHQAEFHPSFKRLQKDYYLYAAQEFTGIKFDIEGANHLLDTVIVEMQEIEEVILPQLPTRKLKKTEQKDYKMPKEPWKMDGSFGHHMVKFIEKHSAEVIDKNTVKVYGKEYRVESDKVLDIDLPMELKDGPDIKQWLMDQGWEPTMWNFKKDPKTNKIMKDSRGQPITTTPKINDGAKICPNLEVMEEIAGDLPVKIAKWLSLKNRRGILKGWLKNRRLAWDGRLPTAISGYTPSTRVKHQVVTNIPSAAPNVTKGKEMRELFIVDEGMDYVSADASGLESRTVSDYTVKYDGGEYAERALEGDVHSSSAKAFFPEETAAFDINSPDFNKEDPGFVPYRKLAKGGNYALAYGCAAKKLADTLKVSDARGEAALKAYWDLNWGLRDFKEALTKYWKTKGNKQFVVAKDGQILFSRSEHSLVNLLGQSLGAEIISYAFCFLDNKLGWLELDKMGRPYYNYKGRVVKRTAAFHDQGDFECDPEVAHEVGRMFVDQMTRAGKYLKMSVHVTGEYKVGKNAAEIH